MHEVPSTENLLSQPLPPEPGEGPIVVRAVDVIDQPMVGTEERALFADIEAALTMTNGRPPSDMEMSLYWQIAQDCDAAARGQSGPGSGLGWVRAAITEAVYSSGTGRVAPKYVARICERWTTDGYLSDGRAIPAPVVPPPPPHWPLTPARESPASQVHASVPESGAPTVPPIPVPGSTPSEADLARMWGSVRRRLEGVLSAEALQLRWFTESRVLAMEGERVTVQAPDAESVLKLVNYRGLISRRLGDLLGRPVEAVFQAAPQLDLAPAAAMDTMTERDDADPVLDVSPSPSQSSTQVHALASPDIPASSPATAPVGSLPAALTQHPTTDSGPLPVVHTAPRRGALTDLLVKPRRTTPRNESVADAIVAPTASTITVENDGETDHALWSRALAQLRSQMNAVTFKVWIEPTALIAREADGTFVIGARNRVQRERLERQHTADIAAALGALLTREVHVRITVTDEAKTD